MARILVGTCNWADHAPFYPKGVKPAERLAYYARYFPIVEVDASFYRLFEPKNFQTWAERTPEDFVFNVKAFRTMTLHGERHQPGAKHDIGDSELDANVQDFKAFSESIQPLREAGKLRSVLFQFPPWFKESPRNREYIAICRELMPSDLLSVEFRHRSWLTRDAEDATFEHLRKLGMAYVCVDQPQIGSASIPSIVRVTNPKLAVVRFHGRNWKTWYIKDAPSSQERFDYRYPEEELAGWLPAIERLGTEAEEIHLMMNNNQANYAIVNARDMMRLLGQEVKEAPELAETEQMKLAL